MTILTLKNITIKTAENQLGNQEVSFNVTLTNKQTKQVLFADWMIKKYRMLLGALYLDAILSRH